MFFDTHNQFLLAVHLNMPSPTRSSILDCYRSSLPGHLQHVDSAKDEDCLESLGQAIHFDWYNRYSTLVSVIILAFLNATIYIFFRVMIHLPIFTQQGFKSLGRSDGLP
jgi:hypothetical protein